LLGLSPYGQIKQTFTALPDARSGNGVYQKYAMSDAALSAFSVFFMQSPSFLDDQKTMGVLDRMQTLVIYFDIILAK
jgi:hypothetical protein